MSHPYVVLFRERFLCCYHYGGTLSRVVDGIAAATRTERTLTRTYSRCVVIGEPDGIAF